MSHRLLVPLIVVAVYAGTCGLLARALHLSERLAPIFAGRPGRGLSFIVILLPASIALTVLVGESLKGTGVWEYADPFPLAIATTLMVCLPPARKPTA